MSQSCLRTTGFVSRFPRRPSTSRACLVILVAASVAFVSLAQAEPAVSNVRAAQRPSTNLVDVYYDLAGVDTDGASVTVALSSDSGASYDLPISSLSGDVGAEVKNALNRRIVWNAGTDKPDFNSATMSLRVTASSAPPRSGFVLIPAGAFQMGDHFAEGWSEELPVHTVTLSAFYMGRTEVTYAQWQAVYIWGLANGYTDLYAGAGKAADHPVHSVSWNDIVKWCNAASERDGLVPAYRTSGGAVHRMGEIEPVIEYANNGYRLPSEAEWEKAARGGLSGKRFPRGDTITHGQANYFSSPSYAYDVSPTRGFHPSYQSGGYPYTSPVGSFAANDYGLYDMAGNAWEWCNDWFGSGYDASFLSSDPRGPSSGYARMLRGGGWASGAIGCRVAYRYDFSPPDNRDGIGFRLAHSL
jgi:formylglycine-generating enzyme